MTMTMISEKAPLIQKHLPTTNDNNNEKPATNNFDKNKNLKLSRDLMYTSHFFAKASDIIWQFCLVLFLAAFTNYKNLILVSTFNLFSGIVVCFTGGYIGTFIDKHERLFTARIFIWIQNVSVVIATFFCYLLLNNDNENNEKLHFGNSGRLKGVPTSAYGISLLIGIHIFGAMANVLDQGITVAIEKDWVVVMSKSTCEKQKSNRNDNEDTEQIIKDWLSETNITMTQIDLTCKSLAPAGAGYLLAIYGDNLQGAALFVGLLNIACLIVEWLCTAFIYELIPDLAIKLDTINSSAHGYRSIIESERTSSIIEDEDMILVSQTQISGITDGNIVGYLSEKNGMKNEYYQYFMDLIPLGWRIYMKQSTAYSGLALSLL